MLDQAEEAMDRSDWESVREHVKVALGLDPGNTDALAFLASVETVLETESIVESSPPLTSPPVPNPTVTPDQPTSFANGRYQVKRFLGEGGKKKVYLAHDGILDRDVALAVIKTEGIDEISRTRITREAQAMGRLGDHPNILQIHDLGDENGQPYLVLPLMTGGQRPPSVSPRCLSVDPPHPLWCAHHRYGGSFPRRKPQGPTRSLSLSPTPPPPLFARRYSDGRKRVDQKPVRFH